MRGLLISASAIALIMPPCANATETVTYSYDAQGRLVQSVISGTVNNGQTSTTTFDAANNRTNYSVSVSGGTPPPPPPPSNQPPVTVADSLSNIPKCVIRSKNVTANDSDPEGNVPLSLVSVVNSNPSLGSASVANASTVQYESGISGGSDTVTYTVQDSLGATSTGTLTVSVSGGTCSAQQSTTPPSAGGGS